MKLTSEEFEELQNQWYEKLRRSGFVDIEIKKDDQVFLKNKAYNNFIVMHPLDRDTQELKFVLLRHKVSDESTVYKNEMHKLIMKMHAEGYKSQAIIQELRKHNIRRCRKTIFNIIRRYEIKWMIRSSTNKTPAVTP